MFVTTSWRFCQFVRRGVILAAVCTHIAIGHWIMFNNYMEMWMDGWHQHHAHTHALHSITLKAVQFRTRWCHSLVVV